MTSHAAAPRNVSLSSCALVERIIADVFNDHRLDRIEEYYDPDCECCDPALPEPCRGVAQLRGLLEAYRAAFPDYRYRIDDIFADGERVALRWSVAGTHQGEFLGHAPTGRAFTVEGLAIVHVANGRVTRAWQHWDDLGLLRQLGLPVDRASGA